MTARTNRDFEARTLALSRCAATRSQEWWRGLRTGLLLSLGAVVLAVGGFLFVLTRP